MIDARTVGKEQGKGMSAGFPCSNFLSALSRLLSTVRNLYWIEIKLEDEQRKYFSLAHDKAYETDKTISKANLTVGWILAGKKQNKNRVMVDGYTPSWVDKQIIKACLPRKEFLYGPKRF